MTVFFSAEERVDFRDLVRDLGRRLHTRIEMKQIGARDETKLAGGVGACGRELCCSSWLREFQPVSVKMAKEQGLSLNPSKLAGMCGRLKCCLRYEYQTYLELGARCRPIGNAGREREGRRQSCAPEHPQADGHGPARRRRRRGRGHARRPGGEEAEPTDGGASMPHRCPLYLTTPLYYVNAEPHLGHTYTTVVADTLARFWRAARATRRSSSPAPTSTATRSRRPPPPAGVTPQAYVDRISGALPRHLGRAAASRYDHFIRTTDPYHVRSCRSPAPRSTPRGDIYFGSYGGLYCYGCERFYHREGAGRRHVPRPPDRAHRDRGGELLLPHERSTRSALLRDARGAARAHPARALPQRGARAAAREPLGDLCISRPKSRLELGHRAAVRRPLRHLRLVRRAAQLRQRARGLRRGQFDAAGRTRST